MSEHLVNLHPYEVKAILENRMSLLVRPVKPQPTINDRGKVAWITSGYFPPEEIARHCPFGSPGDRLYGRETWMGGQNDFWYYKASDKNLPACSKPWSRWRPSTQMPKWAARIWLENTGVRVVRVQDISTLDCLAAGIPQQYGEAVSVFGEQFLKNRANHYWDNSTSIENMEWVWNRHNPRYLYDSNPWAWLAGVKTLSTTGRPS